MVGYQREGRNLEMRVCYEGQDQLLMASPAKLNFYLELHHRRDDGFHELETIMTKFGLFDYLYFKKQPVDAFSLEVRSNSRLSDQAIPTDESNLIIKSLSVMRDLAGCKLGAAIRLFKNIPAQAGMGGASSNAAAAIYAANRLWNLRWSQQRLMQIAAEIGSDVAFFLGANLAKCIGRGEKVQKLSGRCRFNIVVAQPPTGISTAELYARCHVPEAPQNSQGLTSGLAEGDALMVGRNLFNRLEGVAEHVNGDVLKLRSEFARTHCLGHQLTGSGSCYFGLYRHQRNMRTAAQVLANRLPEMNIMTGQSLT